MKYLGASLCTFVFGLSLAACENQALSEMESVRDKICACQDQDCVRALDAEFKATEAKTAKLSKADQEKAIEISLATLECATSIGP